MMVHHLTLLRSHLVISISVPCNLIYRFGSHFNLFIYSQIEKHLCCDGRLNCDHTKMYLNRNNNNIYYKCIIMIYMLEFPVFCVSDYVSTKKRVRTYIPFRISSIAIAAWFRESYKYQFDYISVGIHRVADTYHKLFQNAEMAHKVFINLKIIMVVHNIGLYQKSNWTEKMVKF